MRPCVGCGRQVEQDYLNWCSWECQVRVAIDAGGKVIAPNKLPITCIRHDGALLEHEHADHPDYKFPVDVEHVGPLLEEHWADARMMLNKSDVTEAEARGLLRERHALIYSDGHVAVTMYECCYATWDLNDGLLEGGSLWCRGELKLGEESLKKTREARCRS